MNIKHTPGPWTVGEICNDMMHPDCQGGEFRTIDALHHTALAAVVTRMADDDKSPVCEANAKLIAAAPELLEALIQAKHWHQGDKWRNSDDSTARSAWQMQMNFIDAAITKATA